MSQPFDANLRAAGDAVIPVAQAVAAQDYSTAARLADEALSRGIVHPALFNARALWLQSQGRDGEALAAFQQARALNPRDARTLNAIGLCLTRLGRLDEAIKAFDDALSIEPGYAPTHQRKGLALGLSGRLDAAERAHTEAARLQPRYVEALSSVAAVAARRGNARTARLYAERALKLDPKDPTAHAALALLENAEGNFAAAAQRLAPVLDDPMLQGHARVVVLGLRGDALDGLGLTDEAFAAYSEANAEQKKLFAPRFAGAPSVIRSVEELTSHFAETPAETWRRPRATGETRPGLEGHVFLLGFHRSGTTLLEQALESHPNIATLDERDFLVEPAARFLTSAAGIDLLANADAETLAAARADYWRNVRAQGITLEGHVFVDKHPFNAVKLPLIAAMFPDAKVVFAIRDPRDVVLSCFRRQFDVDLVKFAFLSLDTTAELYDRVMTFGEMCRAKLSMPIFDHRYEDLVADFDGQTKRVCDFIGVPWTQSMRAFSAAAERLDAKALSAGQVKRGLYGEGVGQWRRYAVQLEPVIPILKPWIARFGYDGD